jgi:hypothetical protein
MFPMDSEQGLKATLRALALSAPGQLKLYSAGDSGFCENCRFSTLYNDWVEHFDGPAYLAELDAGRREALTKVDSASKLANEAPCYEHQYLTRGEAFKELRLAAKAALKAFGWTKGAPETKSLWGHANCAAIIRAQKRRERTARLRSRSPGGTEEDFGDIPDFDPRKLTSARFRKLLVRVPWFANLGKPHPRDNLAERIDRWSDWGGPESRGGEPIGPESQIWQDDLLQVDPAAQARTKKLWESVTSECFKAIDSSFHEDLDGDPWHGPSNAAGHAAWVAATIACYLQARQPIPTNVLRQWAWFARGHWPCMYSEDDDLRFNNGRVSVESLEKAWLVVY